MKQVKGAGQSYRSLVWRQFRRNRLAIVGLVVVIFLFLVAIFAGLLANDRPLFMRYQGKVYFPAIREYPEFIHADFKELARSLEAPDWAWFPPVPYSYTEYNFDEVLEKPSSRHWLGTDDRGRDVLARVIHGSRISLSVGFVAVGIYMFIGIIIGAMAGYYGGKVDIVISRIIEIMMCFPGFIFIISLVAFLEPSIYNIMIAIGLIGWTDVARLVRGEFLKIRNREYVEATRALGARDWRTIFRHILPNALAPALVVATFGIAAAILYESALSFLGFGVQPPTPSWGDILSQSRSYYDFAWWLTIFPGVAIFITVTAFNLVNEGLRDAIDPRLKES
jgi:peptide/nickel transport system permease protein